MKTQEAFAVMASAVAVSIGMIVMTYTGSAEAHGCSGPGACQTIQHNPTAHGGSAQQGQKQQQSQAQSQALSGGNSENNISPYTSVDVTDSRDFRSRSLSITPVNTAQPLNITPASFVSRYAGLCGPRMVIEERDVEGRYYGAFSTDTFVAGQDHSVVPADVPYRVVDIGGGIKQLIGNRLVETTAVVTVQGARSVAIAGNASGGGGGSATSGGGGAMQRMVTTVRLEECVAYQITEKPAVLASKPKPKPVVKRKPAPKCPVCVTTKDK